MKSHAERTNKFGLRPDVLKTAMLVLAGAALSLFVFVVTAIGDTLELKTGQIVQGRFVGGSPLNIRFQVDGKEQIFATKDVLNIGFSDTNNASNAPAPPTAPDPQADQPPPPQAPAPLPERPQSQPQVNVAPPPPAPNSMAQPNGSSVQAITIPSGTSLLVRMVDAVDSSTNSVGDRFRANLESALVVGDTIVAPKGADVYGKLAQVKDAGHISGAAQLTLELTGIRINGNIVPVDSTTYDVAGKSRGAQSGERIGGGAVL